MKFGIKLTLWILSMLIVSQIVSAGVTNPLPTELNLLKGESGRFKFQIQTIASNQELFCTYALAKESPLSVDFDPAEITIPAGTVKDVYGTVTVPKSLDLGTYIEEFCISCKPTSGKSGASVAIDTCGLPIKVNVVAERTRENMYVPPKPVPVTAIIIVIIAIAIIIWLVNNIRKKRIVKTKIFRKPIKKRKRKKRK